MKLRHDRAQHGGHRERDAQERQNGPARPCPPLAPGEELESHRGSTSGRMRSAVCGVVAFSRPALQAAVAHGQGAVGRSGDFGIVGHQDNGSPLRRDRVELFEHVLSGGSIECAGGLVRQDDGRIDDKCAGNSERAAARRPTSRGRCPARWPMLASSRLWARAKASGRETPSISSGSATFSAAVSVGRRLIRWNAKPIRRRRTALRSSSASEPKGVPSKSLAGTGRLDPAQQVQQRALARARRPDDRHQFAAADLHVGILQRGDLHGAGAEHLREASALQNERRISLTGGVSGHERHEGPTIPLHILAGASDHTAATRRLAIELALFDLVQPL